MRSRSPFALMGVLIILLLSVLGFAAFSVAPPASSTTPDGVVLPLSASGRIAATAIASQITSAAVEQRLAAPTPREERAGRRAALARATIGPEHGTTTEATATTSTTAAPTTTAAAAPEQAPTTTAAPTTTTVPPPPPPPPTTTTTTTAPPPPPPTHSDGVEQWRPLVEVYWPADLVEDALSVMDCESGGDPDALNPVSGASGLFQFLPSTWTTSSTSAGWAGADVFDGEANIAVAAWLSAASTSPWDQWACKP
ncbi:MAG: transglycosylase SLT domain-containing protein [Acidimicrobiia bacterium]